MSKRDEQNEILEEVVVDETTGVVVVEETKTAKVLKVAKKGLKYAIPVLTAVGGFVVGLALGGKTENDDSEVIDVEFETNAE